jgi:protein subunit release factor A
MKLLRSKILKKMIAERNQEFARLRGGHSQVQWGSQIRSYVLHPYKMVKDLRTEVESGNPDSVLDGELDEIKAAIERQRASILAALEAAGGRDCQGDTNRAHKIKATPESAAEYVNNLKV